MIYIFLNIVLKIAWVNIPDDKILLERIKQDDYLSFNHLFNRYYGRLCAYASKIIADRSAAEDLTQKLLVKMWNSRHQLSVHGSLLSYLFQSLKNASLNYLRNHVCFL